MGPFQAGELTPAQAAKLNQLFRQVQALAGIFTEPPILTHRAAGGQPALSIDTCTMRQRLLEAVCGEESGSGADVVLQVPTNIRCDPDTEEIVYEVITYRFTGIVAVEVL